MRIFGILGAAVIALAATSASAQSFQPAVVSTNLPANEALWHVRVALNVAALGCRDADEVKTIAAYNALIRTQSAALDAANAAIDSHYKAQAGANWIDVRERDMTRLYNYFAQPTAQAQFCAVAKDTLARIAQVEPRDLPGFALASLPALEEPFWPTGNASLAAAPPANVLAAAAVVSVAPGLPQR